MADAIILRGNKTRKDNVADEKEVHKLTDFYYIELC